MRQFQGATSISSEDYFGRSEEPVKPDGLDLNNIELSAREIARKFAEQASTDYEAVKIAVERGSDKLKEYIEAIQVSFSNKLKGLENVLVALLLVKSLNANK